MQSINKEPIHENEKPQINADERGLAHRVSMYAPESVCAFQTCDYRDDSQCT